MIQSVMINEKLIRHYSDEGKRLKQVETSKIYGSEVYDSVPCRYTYEEVAEVPVEEEATAADYEEALESLGVNFNA